MDRDPLVFLWDARDSAEAILRFVAGKTFEDYQADAMLRAAVERKFEIIGEALNRLSKAAPDIAARIGDLPRIVAFRNVLIHGYAVVDDILVWRMAQDKLTPLRDLIDNLLTELDGKRNET